MSYTNHKDLFTYCGSTVNMAKGDSPKSHIVIADKSAEQLKRLREAASDFKCIVYLVAKRSSIREKQILLDALAKFEEELNR